MTDVSEPLDIPTDGQLRYPLMTDVSELLDIATDGHSWLGEKISLLLVAVKLSFLHTHCNTSC
jgi:hypothetical protein